jgi:CheY-specific phosphatase CheX
VTDNQTLYADDVLDELLAAAWQTFLEADLVRNDEALLGGDAIFASISIAGPKNATIVIACDARLATDCASQVLMTAPEDLEPEDTSDVLGELANIVAGNLKGVYGDGDGSEKWSLSLPVVSAGEQVIHGSTLKTRSVFDCDGCTVVCELREPA